MLEKKLGDDPLYSAAYIINISSKINEHIAQVTWCYYKRFKVALTLQ